MIFEMQTGDFLFAPQKGENYSKSDDHLALMMESQHKFPRKFSTVGTNWRKYFDKEGNLRKIKEQKHFPLEEVLLKTYRFKVTEAKAFASFLKPMLQIFPEKRATAADSQQSFWLYKKSAHHLLYKLFTPILRYIYFNFSTKKVQEKKFAHFFKKEMYIQQNY